MTSEFFNKQNPTNLILKGNINKPNSSNNLKLDVLALWSSATHLYNIIIMSFTARGYSSTISMTSTPQQYRNTKQMQKSQYSKDMPANLFSPTISRFITCKKNALIHYKIDGVCGAHYPIADAKNSTCFGV